MSNISVVAQNVQIKDEKITIGELDAILLDNNKPCHIEIVYKFYLYKPDVNGDYISKWVGPNLKDTLEYKLTKLKEKQLPLLYSKQTGSVLNAFSLKAENMSQNVCYKAQLFLPFNLKVDISPLNNNCICGFYLNYKQLDTFKAYKFYISSKLDWLIIPHQNVEWQTYAQAHQHILDHINQKKSPMIWLSKTDGSLSKYFVTFW